LNQSKIVILPIYTEAANAPHQIILVELHKLGLHTLDKLINVSAEELYKVSREIIQSGKFLVTLSDVPDITSLLVKTQLEKWPSMKTLRIDGQVMQQADQDPEWFVKIVDDLPEHIYFSINIEGMHDKSQQIMDLTRELTYRRNIVGLDFIGSGIEDHQTLLCAKLIYQILGFIF
jgi:hypothetical protein